MTMNTRRFLNLTHDTWLVSLEQSNSWPRRRSYSSSWIEDDGFSHGYTMRREDGEDDGMSHSWEEGCFQSYDA